MPVSGMTGSDAVAALEIDVSWCLLHQQHKDL